MHFFSTNFNRLRVRQQHMTGWIESPLLAARIQPNYKTIRSDDFPSFELSTPEQELEQRRSDLRNGLTNRQRLFLFGELGG